MRYFCLSGPGIVWNAVTLRLCGRLRILSTKCNFRIFYSTTRVRIHSTLLSELRRPIKHSVVCDTSWKGGLSQKGNSIEDVKDDVQKDGSGSSFQEWLQQVQRLHLTLPAACVDVSNNYSATPCSAIGTNKLGSATRVCPSPFDGTRMKQCQDEWLNVLQNQLPDLVQELYRMQPWLAVFTVRWSLQTCVATHAEFSVVNACVHHFLLFFMRAPLPLQLGLYSTFLDVLPPLTIALTDCTRYLCYRTLLAFVFAHDVNYISASFLVHMARLIFGDKFQPHERTKLEAFRSTRLKIGISSLLQIARRSEDVRFALFLQRVWKQFRGSTDLPKRWCALLLQTFSKHSCFKFVREIITATAHVGLLPYKPPVIASRLMPFLQKGDVTRIHHELRRLRLCPEFRGGNELNAYVLRQLVRYNRLAQAELFLQHISPNSARTEVVIAAVLLLYNKQRRYEETIQLYSQYFGRSILQVIVGLFKKSAWSPSRARSIVHRQNAVQKIATQHLVYALLRLNPQASFALVGLGHYLSLFSQVTFNSCDRRIIWLLVRCILDDQSCTIADAMDMLQALRAASYIPDATIALSKSLPLLNARFHNMDELRHALLQE
ncbi:hypothetical protein SJAG_04377 [Schizosaccharomyces japonicus yFS275]|uniref:Uncharacterized protein n=1 Tax=Schizosaccharomyces japonicus (strain yFS275 / FY16936) TaxID=402676 RepID=B6K6P0_SCHJY|nr:hypothetical protein SJAG_04377 [Schizosaccharomyces japonicus yFS275]EEB09194.1 hypothetical protein SJAG_04377 [Schizosaccharomyces japonicus yFS275]